MSYCCLINEQSSFPEVPEMSKDRKDKKGQKKEKDRKKDSTINRQELQGKTCSL